MLHCKVNTDEYCGNGNGREMKFCGDRTNLFWYNWKLVRNQEGCLLGMQKCKSYRLMVAATTTEVLPPLSWRSPVSTKPRKLLFSFRFWGWLHMAAPAAGSSSSAGSLQSSCPGFAGVDFCYSALSRPDQERISNRFFPHWDESRIWVKGTFFESSTSARRSMLMVSGITLLFLPVQQEES